MAALIELTVGLIVIHAAWLWFYVAGSLLGARSFARGDDAPLTPGDAALEIVVTTASGIALTGLAGFVLGILHLFYPLAFPLLIVVAGVAAAVLGDSPLRGAFWRRRLRVWRAAANLWTAILYALALTLSAGAILPDGGSDATTYYYTYAFEWAQAHQIITDRWLRFPYYADNWILLYTWFYAFGIERFTQFLTWLTGALSMFGIYGVVLHLSARGGRVPQAVRYVSATIAPLCLLLSPAFLHWIDIGMVDSPLGFFFLASAICMMMIVSGSRRPYLAHLIVCAAFLVGMKTSLIVLLPLFAACAALASRQFGFTAKRTAVTVAAVVLLSAPWYVRSFILAGDPIAPYLNLKLTGADSILNVDDMENLLGNIAQHDTLATLMRLPLSIVTQTKDRFGEPGVTWVLVLLAVPGAVLAYGLFARKLRGRPELYAGCAFLVYAVGYWIQTSHGARYALLFYPLLAGVAAGGVIIAAARVRGLVWAAPLAIALLAMPSPGSAAWLRNHWNDSNGTMWYYYDGRERIHSRLPEIAIIRYTRRMLEAAGKPHAAVFRLHMEMDNLFFREEGLVPIGDWVGPGRYVDFRMAVEHNRLGPYMKGLGIDALLIQTPAQSAAYTGSPIFWSEEDQQQLDREAAALHMVHFKPPGGIFNLYVPAE